MKCPFCVQEAAKSRVYVGGSCSGSSVTSGYYDEEGEWVEPVYTGWETRGYSCSRGHHWTVRAVHGEPEVIVPNTCIPQDTTDANTALSADDVSGGEP